MLAGRERSSLTLTSGGCVSVIWLACACCRPAREGGKEGRRSGVVAGHKQFTQQLLPDLNLTLPKPLNQPPAPGTPSPAPAGTASPPWDHKHSLQKGDFTALTFQTLLPREHQEIQVCSAAFTGRKCWAHTEILLITAQSTRKWEIFVMRDLSWIREEQTSLNEGISQCSTAPVCVFLYLQPCPLMLSHPPHLHPISFYFQQFHCSLISSGSHCSLDQLMVPGGLCHEMWGIWEPSTVCSNSQDSSAWLCPSLSPTEGHRHSWLWVWHHTDRERKILPQPICSLNIHTVQQRATEETQQLAKLLLLVIWRTIGASLNW